MEPDKLKELADSAMSPFIDTIKLEQEQSRYWFERFKAISDQYLELINENTKLREENRKLYMKMLGIEE